MWMFLLKTKDQQGWIKQEPLDVVGVLDRDAEEDESAGNEAANDD